VTRTTERDEILLRVITSPATVLPVMHFKIGHRSAGLASPAVTAKHLIAKLVVQFAVQAQTWLLPSEAIHEAFSVAR
jgi:hypothetical protein